MHKVCIIVWMHAARELICWGAERRARRCLNVSQSPLLTVAARAERRALP